MQLTTAPHVYPLERYIKKYVFMHLNLCFAVETHNFMWMKTTHICLFWDQAFENPDV